MKSYLLIIVLFTISLFQAASQAPDWVWARSGPSGISGGSEGISVTTDLYNNVYVTGFYKDTIRFGTYTLSAVVGQENAYLAKYDPYGNVLWAKGNQDLSNLSFAVGYGVCTDAFGNCYLTGSCGDGVSFGPYTVTGSIFLVKYDASGNVIWAKCSGGFGVGSGYSVAADTFGNVFITGSFGAPSIAFGPYTLQCAGVEDIFLAKYDSSGNVLWAKGAGGSSGRDIANSVATDASGNACITGNFFSDTCFFGSYALVDADLWHNDFFIAKYDPSGNVLWAKRSGGTDNDQGNGIATDAAQNIYVEGMFFSSSITFDSYTLTNAAVADFLVKYDPSGNVLWAKKIGGVTNSPLFSEHCVATDNYGKVYLTGVFSGSIITFDTVILHSPSGPHDPMFVVAYDSSGHALFAKALASGGDDWNSVATSPSGCVYISGDFASTRMTVGNDTLTLMPSSSTENVFVAKMCYSGPAANFTCSDTSICAEGNNCINFLDQSGSNPTSWHWIFNGANPSSSNLQNPTNICYGTPGTFPVTLIVTNFSGTDTLTVSPMIIVGSPPPPPVITVVGTDTLISSHGSSYQWYLNGIAITGATDSFYVEHQSGTYSVQISDNSGGCRALSTGVAVGVIELSDGEGITIFPNPFSDELTVTASPPAPLQRRGEELEIIIYDIASRKILRQKFTSSLSINTRSIAQGVYLYEVKSKDGILARGRVVKE